MRIITTRRIPADAEESAEEVEEQLQWYVRFAVRLAIGVFLGAVLGPPLQRGLALVSLRYVVTVALATVALSLLGSAVARTVQDFRRARRGLQGD